MGFKDARFAKPSASFTGPSRHLYVAGVGDQLKSDKNALVAFFSRFGELDSAEEDEGVYMPSEKRFLFVTYVHVDHARAAFEALSSDPLIPDLNAHNLIVKYACLASSKRPPEPECTSSTAHIEVPGVAIIPDFLGEAEEQQLLSFYEQQEWKLSLQRRVQHYGYIFNYRTLMMDYVRSCPPLPDHVAPLAERIYEAYERHATSTEQSLEGAQNAASLPSLPREQLHVNQLTVNEYLPGQGIAPHVDTKACIGPALFVVNLGADVVMSLTRSEDADDHLAERKYTFLPRRSLLILAGPARYEYAHSIAPRKFDKVDGQLLPRHRRISLTFRHAVAPASPPYSEQASTPIDSNPDVLPSPPADVVGDPAQHLEDTHVHQVYDSIAQHWHHTRGRRKVHWHRVKAFLLSLPAGSLVADVGCGDGKYFGVNPAIQVVGCDRSLQLLRVCKADESTSTPTSAATHESFCCDALALPFKDAVFDATLCIAVLHHLSNASRRLRVLYELARITREGGHIFVQAWAQEQETNARHRFETQDVFVPWKLDRRYVHSSSTQSKVKEDAESPSGSISRGEKAREEGNEEGEAEGDISPLVYQRYCHVYRQGELEDLCSCVPHVKIHEAGFDRGNWFVHLVKQTDSRLGITTEDFGLPNWQPRNAQL